MPDLPPFIEQWSPDDKLDWEERSAIMEYDCGLFRHCAEYKAEKLIRLRRKQKSKGRRYEY